MNKSYLKLRERINVNKVDNNWHSNISNKNHEEIVQAGKELFLRNNFYNIKITDICNLSGVSRVTFYKHFKTIDELIFEVQMNILSEMNEFIKERSNIKISGKESIKTILYAWIDYAKEHKDEMKFIVSFDLYYSSYDLSEELKLKYKSFTVEDYNRSLLKLALDKGIEDGTLNETIDTSRMGIYIHQTVMGLLQRMSYTTFSIGCENITFEEVTTKIVDMIIHSIEKTKD